MGIHLIAKLAAPRAAETVRRARVSKIIDRALRTGACWIAAPAGYGKTTAMVDYLARSEAPHVWFRVDEGDRDIARFFSYMAQSLPSTEAASGMPVFGVEYADAAARVRAPVLSRLFRRAQARDVAGPRRPSRRRHAGFRSILAVMLSELPTTLRCVCLSRKLPADELGDMRLSGALTVVGQSALEFSDQEARSLISLRTEGGAADVDVDAARGWAVGLVLLAERRGLGNALDGDGLVLRGARPALFRHDAEADQDMLLTLNLLPEITVEPGERDHRFGRCGKAARTGFIAASCWSREPRAMRRLSSCMTCSATFCDDRFEERLSQRRTAGAAADKGSVGPRAGRAGTDDAISARVARRRLGAGA